MPRRTATRYVTNDGPAAPREGDIISALVRELREERLLYLSKLVVADLATAAHVIEFERASAAHNEESERMRSVKKAQKRRARRLAEMTPPERLRATILDREEAEDEMKRLIKRARKAGKSAYPVLPHYRQEEPTLAEVDAALLQRVATDAPSTTYRGDRS